MLQLLCLWFALYIRTVGKLLLITDFRYKEVHNHSHEMNAKFIWA